MSEPSFILILDFLTAIILLTSLFCVSVQNVKSIIYLYAFISFLLGLLTLVIAYYSNTEHLVMVALAFMAIKAFFIPVIMLYILPYTLKQTTNYSTVKLLILGAICIIISYFFTKPIISILGLVNKHLLPISVSVIFLGIFMLITRLSKLTQFIGLAIAEHGMFLTATSLSGGMPTIVEFGILFDGIMGVALAFYLIRRVSLYKEGQAEVKELP